MIDESELPQPQPQLIDGLPVCHERCPAHDGKRCELMGFPPTHHCEPALKTFYGNVSQLCETVQELQKKASPPCSECTKREVAPAPSEFWRLNRAQGGKRINYRCRFHRDDKIDQPLHYAQELQRAVELVGDLRS